MMTGQALAAPRILGRYRGAIERELRELVADHKLPLYQMIRYHLGFEDRDGGNIDHYAGKALRPSLLLFAHEALGGELREALPAAVAVELTHSFSLVHDDIQDRDLERHGHPAVWQLFGVGQAINAGDALRELAALSMLELQGRFPPEVILGALQLLDRATLEMIEGQYLDLGFEAQSKVTIQDYLEMIERKTGALLGAALEIGAKLAGGDQQVIQSFKNCGRRFGLCFQIRDDILGIWGDRSRTGKSTTTDILRRKKSLPIVYLLNSPQGAELRPIYQKAALDKGDLRSVMEMLDEAGAREWSEGIAEEHCRQALAELKGMELPRWAGELLEELAQFLLTRER
ncbi:MAG: polyprenyl synthetase family protein [Candidatus Bipolaricaulia bacterium]